MFPAFSSSTRDFYSGRVSDNYRFYAQKLSAARTSNRADGSLRDQLVDLLETVRWCEAMWRLEDRIDHDLERERDA